MRQAIAALISRRKEWRQRVPTVLALGIWDSLSHLGELDQPVYICAFASELGYQLWKEHEQTPDITPARFVEHAHRLLYKARAQGAGYILDLTPDLREIVSRSLPLLAAAAGGSSFGRRVEQLLQQPVAT